MFRFQASADPAKKGAAAAAAAEKSEKEFFQEILRRFTFSSASVNIAFRSYDACASERKRVFDSDACDFSSAYNYSRSLRDGEAK